MISDSLRGVAIKYLSIVGLAMPTKTQYQLLKQRYFLSL
jgi:hypothetical protein